MFVISIVLDIVLVAVFAACVLWAARKGFVLTLLDLAAVVLAAFCAVKLGAWLAPILYQSVFSQPVADTIASNLPSMGGAMSATQQVQTVLDGLPSFVVQFAQSVGISTAELAGQIGAVNLDGAALAQQLADKVAAPLVISVCRVVIFLVGFLLLAIVFKLLARLVNQFFKLPVLRTANAALGGLLGAAKGVLFVFLLCVVLQFIASYSSGDSGLSQAVSSSRITAFVVEHNPFTGMLQG